MKKSPITYFFILIIFLETLNSCNKREGCFPNRNVSLVTIHKTDSFRIPVDSLINMRKGKAQFFNTDSGLIFTYYRTPHIILFNTKTGFKQTNRLDISAEKLHLVGMYVHNLDSIFGINGLPCKLVLFNRFGRIINAWDIKTLAPYSNQSCNATAYPYLNLLSFKNNQIYFYCNRFEKDPQFNNNFIVQFDIKTSQIVNIIGDYPSVYKKEYSEGHVFIQKDCPYFCLSDNYIVTSFEVDHRIFTYSIKNGEFLNEICARSSFLSNDKFKSVPKTMYYSGIDQLPNYLTTEPAYFNIFYDDISKCYFRYVKLSCPLKNSDGRLSEWDDPKLSMVIMDKDFNFIGETLIPGNTYDYRRIFFNQGKIIFYRINNEDYSFDHFDIYTLKKQNI